MTEDMSITKQAWPDQLLFLTTVVAVIHVGANVAIQLGQKRRVGGVHFLQQHQIRLDQVILNIVEIFVAFFWQDATGRCWAKDGSLECNVEPFI